MVQRHSAAPSSPARPVESPSGRSGPGPASRAGFGWRGTSAASPVPSTHPRRAGGDAVPLPVPPAPIAVLNASVSAALRSSLAETASASAAFTRASALVKMSRTAQPQRIANTDSRRCRACGSVASRGPGDVAAADRRRPPRRGRSMPSRCSNTSAMAAVAGVRRLSARQRDRIVTEMSSGGRTARRAGTRSGPAAPRRLEQRVGRALGQPVGVLDDHDLPAPGGRPLGRDLHQRPHFPHRDGQPFRHDEPTSAWVPCMVVRQPALAAAARAAGASHCNAAAKARAAVDRPEPGGPVNSHAWVIAPGVVGRPATRSAAASAAVLSTSTAWDWPTTSAHTVMPAPARSPCHDAARPAAGARRPRPTRRPRPRPAATSAHRPGPPAPGHGRGGEQHHLHQGLHERVDPAADLVGHLRADHRQPVTKANPAHAPTRPTAASANHRCGRPPPPPAASRRRRSPPRTAAAAGACRPRDHQADEHRDHQGAERRLAAVHSVA